jgi:chemotaxis protein MotB
MRAFRDDLSNTFGTASRRRQRTKSVEVHNVHGVRLELAKEGHAEGDAHADGTWIFSFADLIMNLLMFFVMMFAISSVDKGKFQEIQQAFSTLQPNKPETKAQVGKGTGIESSYAASTGVATAKSKMSNKEILDKVNELLTKIDKKSLDKVQNNKVLFDKLKPEFAKLSKNIKTELKADPLSQGFEIVITAKRLFGENEKALVLSEEGKQLLSKISTELAGMPRPLAILVQGFKVNKLADKTVQPKSQDTFLESVTLANKVRTELEVLGLSSSKHSMQVTGFGEFNEFHGKSNAQIVSNSSRIVLKIAALPEEGSKP